MGKKRGKFIVIEGPDHCGKTTLLQEIAKRSSLLVSNGNIMFTREPGGLGIRVNEEIRTILLTPGIDIHPVTEAYLYAASRAQHIVQIEKWLEEGCTVVSDRYVYSSYVYQGIGRGLGPNVVYDINKTALNDLTPDAIFYLQIDMDTYRARKQEIASLDRIELESEAFFKKIVQGYDDMFLEDVYLIEHDILRVIDARRSANEVLDDVMGQLTEILKED